MPASAFYNTVAGILKRATLGWLSPGILWMPWTIILISHQIWNFKCTMPAIDEYGAGPGPIYFVSILAFQAPKKILLQWEMVQKYAKPSSNGPGTSQEFIPTGARLHKGTKKDSLCLKNTMKCFTWWLLWLNQEQDTLQRAKGCYFLQVRNT